MHTTTNYLKTTDKKNFTRLWHRKQEYFLTSAFFQQSDFRGSAIGSIFSLQTADSHPLKWSGAVSIHSYIPTHKVDKIVNLWWKNQVQHLCANSPKDGRQENQLTLSLPLCVYPTGTNILFYGTDKSNPSTYQVHSGRKRKGGTFPGHNRVQKSRK